MNNPQPGIQAAAEEKLSFSVLVVVIIGTFMSILDGTIVNVSLPKMISVFNSSPVQAQWIVTVYMLTLGIVMPVSGYLGDRFGYKRMYSSALLLFVLGSFLCGTAWSVNSMIVFRVIQALGGGVMMPLGMAILYQNYPREKMGMVLGMWGISVMLAPAIGPALGGYLVDYASWRLIFYFNVPLGILNIFMAASRLRETPLIKGQRFDYVGVVSSTVGFFCLLLALSQANRFGWTSPYIVFLLFLAGFSLTILVYNELHHSEPLLDLRLFKNYIFAISVVVSSIISIGMYSVIFLIPLLLQSILGQSAMQTGLILFPAALASGIVMPFSGRLFDRYGPRTIVVGGLAVLVVTTYMLHTFNAMTPFLVMIFWLAARGFGMGFCFMPSTTAGMNTVPPHLVGRASALNNVIRQVASAFGISMFIGVFQHRQAVHLVNLAGSINLDSNQYLLLKSGMTSLVTALGVPQPAQSAMSSSMVVQLAAKESMIMAMGDCFLVATALCLAAMLLALFFRGRSKPARDAD